jgi:hypothetical protein
MDCYLSRHIAEKLGCSLKWVQVLANREGSEMGAFRLSPDGHWRFRKREFDRWFEQRGSMDIEVDVRTKRVVSRSLQGHG